jgi:Fur family transcriptional regulator, zinc uptake regulator
MKAKAGSAEDFLAYAERVSSQQGVRLTPLRRQVLGLIADQSRPITAYQLLRRLHKHRPDAAPTAVYRSVEFLTKLGLVQRIVSMRAYICTKPRPADSSAANADPIFICEQCHRIFQLPETGLASTAIQTMQEQGFVVHAQHLEIHGLCASCSEPRPE